MSAVSISFWHIRDPQLAVPIVAIPYALGHQNLNPDDNENYYYVPRLFDDNYILPEKILPTQSEIIKRYNDEQRILYPGIRYDLQFRDM